jgi:hypothetical protein
MTPIPTKTGVPIARAPPPSPNAVGIAIEKVNGLVQESAFDCWWEMFGCRTIGDAKDYARAGWEAAGQRVDCGKIA